MIAELVELWSWFFGMIAGWGATTIGIVAALVILYIKHLRLKNQVDHLYSRLVSFEREVSLKQKWNDK
jgi:hypothetical protein